MATSLLKTIGLSFAGSTISFLSDLILADTWSVEVLKEQDMSKQDIDLYTKARKSVNDFRDEIRIIGFHATPIDEYIKIADFDSFISMNGVKDSQIVENAVEGGSFRSVNKVIKPRQLTIELARGGGFKFLENGIRNMIYNLEQYQGSTVLCRVITPYGVLNNLNLKKFEYGFTRDTGSCLLIAKLTFQEIIDIAKRQKVKVEKVKDGSLSDTVDSGEKVCKVVK